MNINIFIKHIFEPNRIGDIPHSQASIEKGKQLLNYNPKYSAIEDLAEACVYCLQNIDFKDLSNNKTEVKNTHINIGTGKDLTIKNLAEKVKEITGFNGKLVWDSSKPDGTPRKLMNVSKINNLGWKEKVDLAEGIERVYRKYQE